MDNTNLINEVLNRLYQTTILMIDLATRDDGKLSDKAVAKLKEGIPVLIDAEIYTRTFGYILSKGEEDYHLEKLEYYLKTTNEEVDALTEIVNILHKYGANAVRDYIERFNK